MTRFKNIFSNANSIKREAASLAKKTGVAVPGVIITGLMLLFAAQVFTARAESVEPIRFTLTAASNLIGNCLPTATAHVTVLRKDDVHGTDTLDLKAEGLPANTEFAVFLTESPVAPFGAVEYVGDFVTNASGKGSLRVDAIVEEAFSSTEVGNNLDRVRKELNHMVIWFADPAADDICPGPGTKVTTPFDGDGEAGAAALSSRNFLPGAPLP